MPQLPSQDTELLEAALIGFMHQKEKVEQKIEELHSRINGQPLRTAAQSTSGYGKRTLSAAARQRIALAQKKRWAAYKRDNGTASKPKPQKRVLSAAGRARIIAATKKRWAAFRKAQASRAAS
jgi:hypothetical protein